MTLPRNFYKPLAIDAPEPFREPPARLERMIHFVPPHVNACSTRSPRCSCGCI
jgi:malyl-CoA/(S)-citramalyl-CoA lyase